VDPATAGTALPIPHYDIAVIPGDGIGREVMPAALEVLRTAGQRFGFALSFDVKPWGCEFYAATGQMMPEDGLTQLAATDAILLGAVGTPGVPDHVSLWGLLIPIRRAFHQYVNLRPVRQLPGVDSPLRWVPVGGVDLVIVRENSEGEYSQVGGRFGTGTENEFAIQDAIFTRRGCERILRFAFGLASQGGKAVCVATKSNGIVHSMPFWDEIATSIAAEHPDVPYQIMHVDALAAKFVLDPGSLDVVVASNLFGDILSDLGAAVAGSIGTAPSANLDPSRRFPSMFEPVHGSAPDIVGMHRANPVGQIWSAAMLLDHLGEADAAAAVMNALRTVTASPQTRTPDIGGVASTEVVTDAVVAQLGSNPIPSRAD
jgi:tartrate dehydrogenase/decarboxylase/D-malate dehydrogenase